jgi:hypothetical protein
VAGLTLAGISAYFAKRAAKAARDARQAVLASTLAEEINLARTVAAEITTLADMQGHAMVRLRCNDLLDRTHTILTRWDRTLSTGSKNNFLSAKSQLESLRSVATKMEGAMGTPTPRQLSLLQDTCGRIREIFIQEHASAMRRNDEVDNA